MGVRLGGAAASLALGLVLAEGAAGAAHRGAYPYLNIFEPDALFGVRLRPSASTRTRSRGGTVTEVRTNEEGFRGPSWTAAPGPEPVRGRALLLGDSQMFGYGVPYERATAAVMEREGGYEVLNGAVPTWGPTEFAPAIDQLVPRFRPEVVVLVTNVANDWFEATVPNRRRTTARDGWAARPTPGEEPPRWFPGRSFVLGRSHLVLMSRSLWAFGARPQAPLSEGPLRVAREAPKLAAQHRAGSAPMTQRVREAQQACERQGCRLLVSLLPLDAQVDGREWVKYRTPPRSLAEADALVDAFAEDLDRQGLPPLLDLRPPLRAASPGAFLDDDYHLSPRGHQAVGHALAAALAGEAQRAQRPGEAADKETAP